MKLHFIGGLPRSGTTMLAAILNQNPKFKASGPSPLYQILTELHTSMGTTHYHLNENLTDNIRISTMTGMVQGFYQNTKKVVFDTGNWQGKASLVSNLFPSSKMICCVRNLAWIIDSLEHNVHKNWVQPAGTANHQKYSTLYSRVSSYLASDGLVGSAIDSLREVYYGEFSKHLILVEYDKITKNPEEIIRKLYDNLRETYYDHDYSNLSFNLNTHDERYGVKGLHTVKSKVEPHIRKTILPPDIFDRYNRSEFWKTDPQTQAVVL